MKRNLLLTAILFCGITAKAQTVVKDIEEGNWGSSPSQLTDVNGTLFFRADTYNNGIELWKTDGSEAGTILLKDIYPGQYGSLLNGFSSYLTNVNGRLFFLANDSVHGEELWVSNGTPAGTVMVKDINPGESSSRGSGDGSQLTNVNGTLFFRAYNGVGGDELWKSDGTAAGTVMVKDIAPIWSSYPTALTNVNGTLFFNATDESKGNELWKSDGTTAGTVMVKDITSGSSEPAFFTNVNGTLFFTAYTSATGRELWKSDGSAAGTVMIKDINPGSGHSANYTNVNNFLNINGTLFFSADNGVNGIELWKSDGTEAGTVMVKDIAAGKAGGLNLSNIRNFTNVNGMLFFYANDSIHGPELWKSDGTTAGTVMVKDIRPGTIGAAPGNLVSFNNMLYFTANDGTGGGATFWRTDGTTAGTIEINDKLRPERMVVSNNLLYFAASNSEVGYELWKFNGNITSAVEKVSTSKLGVYPNPAAERLTVEGDFKGKAIINLVDVSGKVMLSQETENTTKVELNTENLAAGIYIMTIRNGAKQEVRKVSIVK